MSCKGIQLYYCSTAGSLRPKKRRTSGWVKQAAGTLRWLSTCWSAAHVLHRADALRARRMRQHVLACTGPMSLLIAFFICPEHNSTH